MTVCVHEKNRIVPVQYERSDGNLFKSSDTLSLFLIRKGTILLNLNERQCFLGGKIVVCTNNLDRVKLIYQAEADVDVLHFAPSFINVNLSWNTIRSLNYEKLCKKYAYPDFRPFLDRSLIYNGILVLDEAGYDKISTQMNLLNEQLSEQPDAKWSCRSRGFLLQIMDVLNLYYEKYVGSYLHDSLAWEICQYINLNLDSKLSLELFSKLFSINRTSLSERFKAAVGMTVSEYIKEKRISHMKHLLAFTELSLLEIGEQVGFHDQSYLSKMFVKEVKITPLKYRIMMKAARRQN